MGSASLTFLSLRSLTLHWMLGYCQRFGGTETWGGADPSALIVRPPPHHAQTPKTARAGDPAILFT